MKSHHRIVSLVLAAFSLFSVSGCAAQPAPRASNAGTSSTSSPTEPALPTVPSIPVIVGGQTDYSLYLGDGVAESCSDELDWLARVMDEKYGTHPPVSTDSAPASGHSISLSLSGESMDWSVTVDAETGNLTLQGGSAAALKKAILYVGTQFCGNSDGDLSIAVDGSHRYTYADDQLDNSGFLTYLGHDQATLSDSTSELMSPVWLDTAIMVEVRLDTASLGGTFQEATRLVDFYASAGVNVIWLDPIYERTATGNGYSNAGLHTVEPLLTGTTDREESWQIVREFVDYAHSKGVYILLDLVTWGCVSGSELFAEHPDWFSGEAWGGDAFRWSNPELREWFIAQAVTNLEITGADGYRCDCEPFTAGYEVFAEIRRRLNEKGIYPMIMSESGGRRQNTFDCEQDGVLNYSSMSRAQLYQETQANFFVDGYLSIIDSVRNGTGLGAGDLQRKSRVAGTYRYYTNCITNHDYQNRSVCGNRLKIGYAALYAPFIPLWYMGDEFGVVQNHAVLYDLPVNYDEITAVPEQGLFFEDVKQMIAIRRTYADLFESFPLNHRDANICAVSVSGLTNQTTEAYARYADNRMVIILANHAVDQTGVCQVSIPFAEGFSVDYPAYRVTDLLSGRVVAVGSAEAVDGFSAVVPFEYCGVFLVEGIDSLN